MFLVLYPYFVFCQCETDARLKGMSLIIMFLQDNFFDLVLFSFCYL